MPNHPYFAYTVSREEFRCRGIRPLDSFRPLDPKTFDSYILDMMYVEFMKNFLLADSSELMAVRLISAS